MRSPDGKPNLLIADDYAPARFTLSSAACECGYFENVHTVADGEAALDFIDHCTRGDAAPLPDIIISDLYMHGINGIQLLLAVGRNSATSRIIRVLISAGNDPVERDAARRARCDAFFQKPVSSDSLRALLQSASDLFRQRQRDNSAQATRCPIETVCCNSAMYACSTAQMTGRA